MQGNIQRYYQHLGQTSKTYRIVMVVLFFGHFIFSWSIMHSLMAVPEQFVDRLIIRSLLEALLLITICHFLLRPYLRMKMLAISLTNNMVIKSIIYIFFISIIYFAISYFLGKVDFLNITDVQQMQIKAHGSTVSRDLNFTAIALIGIGKYFFILTSWSVCYLAFKYQSNKRALQKEVVENQILQLTNQLSPHFLFNTLNSIRALIFADQEKAAEMITLLSDLLRTQMKSHTKIDSTLKQDWRVTQDYLNIEIVRFEDRLTVEYDFAEETLNQSIPTLTLLTLTENAIKHGISPSSKAGTILYCAQKISKDYWSLTVRNTLFNDVKKHGTQVGLHNVKKRLSLMFGNNYQFKIERGSDYFLVSMELPYVKNLNS